MKKCKHCKEHFKPYNSLQKYCFKPECTEIFVKEAKLKQWQKKKRALDKELETVQDLIKLAQKVFNQFIRLRDEGLNCISCGNHPKKANAGHYFNANNHWNVRFDELNVHLQCEHCNSFLSGNLILYREGLMKKIGIEKFTELEAEAYKTKKFTREELHEIIKIYKEKVKLLKK